ncbi:MAG: ribbon-helix-helix domain-containing protein [Anaerolineae bacterium]|nr:ribbon-helix-helix domain-containing protein [Anaerolineae bacterium]NUQ03097.1 ribbon-helix-helix protein, CopG family [Anaerolineae bacterium]
MADRNKEFPKRLTVQVTEAMDDRLEQVARGRDEAKAEVVRAALRAFLDEQEDVIGSRKHFTKAFGRRVDHIERLLSVTLWLNLQTLHLLSERLRKEQVEAGDLLADAITEGVDLHDTVSEWIETVAAGKKTEPPA